MPEIIIKTTQSKKAIDIIQEAIATEEMRIKHALESSERRIEGFEKRYMISSETFMKEWAAEDLQGKDIEYVEWAGEIKLFERLRDRLLILQDIEYVS